MGAVRAIRELKNKNILIKEKDISFVYKIVINGT